MAAVPILSVVIAAFNASDTIAAALHAVCAQAGPEHEVIVVDDCSTDATAVIAGSFPVQLLRLESRRGAAAARNAGARAARAPVLLFLDADVVAADNLLGRGLDAMNKAGADAMIGSYDAQPADHSTVSMFKNLAHHHFHQRARREAVTFWGACGFIRRELFLGSGGFDEGRYMLPSIEDVELGARIVRGGARIIVDPTLQVTHLKRWSLFGLLKTDVMRRAIPWTLLALETDGLPADLNFSRRQRFAALTAVGLAAAVGGTLWRPGWWPAVAALLVAAIFVNRDLYRLFYNKGGLRLAFCGFMLQQLYYLYSLAGLATGLVIHYARRIARPRAV